MVVAPGGFRLVGLNLYKVLALLLEALQMGFAELVWPGARRTEVGMQTLAAPRRLDDQDGPVIRLFHCEAEGELRPDLATVFGGIAAAPIPGGELA